MGINYKLKSVAHMPWRVLAYKFFNTFIDDVFAFFIMSYYMTKKHRYMTLRDDLVFFIFMYQRYLYKVDPTRADEFGYVYGDAGGEPELPVTDGDGSTLEDSPKAPTKRVRGLKGLLEGSGPAVASNRADLDAQRKEAASRLGLTAPDAAEASERVLRDQWQLDDVVALIVDNGSAVCRAGLAGEDEPRCVIPSRVCRASKEFHMSGVRKDYYIGKEVEDRLPLMSVNRPIQHGIVTDWEDMEKIWQHIFFSELTVDPEKHAVLLPEAPLNPRGNRERLTQIMFNKFKFSAMCVRSQAVLSLYATGCTTGIVMEAGDGLTHTMPICHGHALPHAMLSLNFAGRGLTDYLMQLLAAHGHILSSEGEREIVRNIKENHCFVALDPTDTGNHSQAECLLGINAVTLRSERFECPEVLFKPHIMKTLNVDEARGIHSMVFESIQKCDVDLHKDLYSNVVLSGGTAKLEGLAQRMTLELQKLVHPSMRDHVHVQVPSSSHAVWTGGSRLARDQGVISCDWMLREEYDESGASIVHTKCL